MSDNNKGNIPWPDISTIQKKRVKLGLTQKELARLSGIAQPDISRLEKGLIREPAYTTVRKLIDALRNYENKLPGGTIDEPIVAERLMNRDVVSLKPHDRVADAAKIMKERNFSQLPVMDDRGRVVGGVSESLFLSNDGTARIEDVMGDSFPIVGKDTRLGTISAILQKEPAVLVVHRGKVLGIVTKYDVYDKVFSSKTIDRFS